MVCLPISFEVNPKESCFNSEFHRKPQCIFEGQFTFHSCEVSSRKTLAQQTRILSFEQNKSHRLNSNHFSKFLLNILFFPYSLILWKGKIVKMNKSITFSKTALSPCYREKQKICGTSSLERSFAVSFKKNSHRSRLPPFRVSHEADEPHSQKPQGCRSTADADFYICGAPRICTAHLHREPGCFPSLHTKPLC
jgi:hypothetical protein